MRPTRVSRATGGAMPSASSAFRPYARAAPCCHRGHHAIGSATRSTFQASRTPTLKASRSLRPATPATALLRARAASCGEATGGTSMRGKPRFVITSPLPRAWYKRGSRTHDKRIISPLLYPSELACVDQIPARAVHAHAIHSASAPGGTHEPAPLTRPFLCSSVRHRDRARRRIFPGNNPPLDGPRFRDPQNEETPVSAADRGLSWDTPKGCVDQPFDIIEKASP